MTTTIVVDRRKRPHWRDRRAEQGTEGQERGIGPDGREWVRRSPGRRSEDIARATREEQARPAAERATDIVAAIRQQQQHLTG